MAHRTAPITITALALAASLLGCSSAPPAATTPPAAPSAPVTPTPPAVDVSDALAALELEFDARVGVSAVDTGSGARISHRADERFGYASSLKVLAAAQLLRAVPAAEREEVVTWTEADVATAGYSPVTSGSVDEGLTLARLAEAAVRRSDNTALNLVLARLGGPEALGRGLGELGDTTTRVVNGEPALNTIEPGGIDDTSTPAAFTADLARVTLGDALAPDDRALLLQWMSGNATGDTLIRAGAPAGWSVADKSGGTGGIRNDVAVVTPPGRAPIVLTVFTTRNDPDAEYDDALVARTAEVVLGALP
jgi:beta-lactamase class A